MKQLKKIELATYDVVEMNQQELMDITGGTVWDWVCSTASSVGQSVANAAVAVWNFLKQHVHISATVEDGYPAIKFQLSQMDNNYINYLDGYGMSYLG